MNHRPSFGAVNRATIAPINPDDLFVHYRPDKAWELARRYAEQVATDGTKIAVLSPDPSTHEPLVIPQTARDILAAAQPKNRRPLAARKVLLVPEHAVKTRVSFHIANIYGWEYQQSHRNAWVIHTLGWTKHAEPGRDQRDTACSTIPGDLWPSITDEAAYERFRPFICLPSSHSTEPHEGALRSAAYYLNIAAYDPEYVPVR